MKQQRKKIRKGFTFYLVIVAIALTGSSLFLLTHISNGMAHRSDRMYLKACYRNLRASGLVWVRHNATKIAELPSNEPCVLDTTDLQIPDSHINVSRGNDGDSHKDKKLTIEVRCSKRKMSIRQKTIVSPNGKREERRNEEIPMMNGRKSVKEHLSEIQKGGTRHKKI